MNSELACQHSTLKSKQQFVNERKQPIAGIERQACCFFLTPQWSERTSKKAFISFIYGKLSFFFYIDNTYLFIFLFSLFHGF